MRGAPIKQGMAAGGHLVSRKDCPGRSSGQLCHETPARSLRSASPFAHHGHELLGLKVPNDRLGCLQDIHWPGGAWGYFPTYTLGAMAAAQLFDAACRAEPEVRPALGRGDFEPLRTWLRTNVHAKGSLLETDEILTEATGRPLEAETYRRHLQRRYLGQVAA